MVLPHEEQPVRCCSAYRYVCVLSPGREATQTDEPSSCLALGLTGSPPTQFARSTSRRRWPASSSGRAGPCGRCRPSTVNAPQWPWRRARLGPRWRWTTQQATPCPALDSATAASGTSSLGVAGFRPATVAVSDRASAPYTCGPTADGMGVEVEGKGLGPA